MGHCQSKEDKKLQERSREIDRKIKENASEYSRVIKLLLLGAGECGKSTILKQMRFVNEQTFKLTSRTSRTVKRKILHKSGFTEDELSKQRLVVFNNTVQAMAAILEALTHYHIAFDNPLRQEDAAVITNVANLNTSTEHEAIAREVAIAIKNLWQDSAVQSIYERRYELHLHESTKYFFDNVDRITAPNYIPNEQDMLLTRVKTTGIVEVNFIIQNTRFRVFDVGGQRSERKKWIHCFEDANAVIYIAAISEYDEVLFEDNTTNRILESMRLFESICNIRWFANTSIILFLNKKDLFAEKIKTKSIKVAFPQYEGPQTFEDSVAFIRKRFIALNANPQKTIYVHLTCATDTNHVQKILDNVIDMISQNNLKKSGLL